MTHVTICTAYRHAAKYKKQRRKNKKKNKMHTSWLILLTSVRFWVKYTHENQCETKSMLNLFHFPVYVTTLPEPQVPPNTGQWHSWVRRSMTRTGELLPQERFRRPQTSTLTPIGSRDPPRECDWSRASQPFNQGSTLLSKIQPFNEKSPLYVTNPQPFNYKKSPMHVTKISTSLEASQRQWSRSKFSYLQGVTQ